MTYEEAYRVYRSGAPADSAERKAAVGVLAQSDEPLPAEWVQELANAGVTYAEGITWREWFAPGSKAVSIKVQASRGSRNRRRPPVPNWDQLDGKAREEAWQTIQLHYQAEEGSLLSDKEVLRRYRADLLGLDWRSAPRPRTSLGHQVIKGAALVALFPLMLVSPRATTAILERIDRKLSDDQTPPLLPVTTLDDQA